MATNRTKAVAAASAGNALEWYDFSIFAFFAAYIGHSFFEDGNETAALVKTFLVFGVGFIARPLGALFLGAYGDKVGRKAALTLTISLMALGTLIIAVTPPVWVIGAGAPILLLVGRLLQGFSAGGEIGGATAFLVETAPEKQKATYAAWLQASMGISNILAALAGWTVSSLFSPESINQWAWRLPFIFGLLIVPVGVYIRRTLNETEEFSAIASRKEHSPLSSVFRQYPLHLLAGVLFSILWTASVYTLIIYMPTYYASPNIGLGFQRSDSFLAALLGNVFMVIGCLASGRYADKIGVYKILTFAIVLLSVGTYPILSWLQSSPTVNNLIIAQSLFCIMMSIFAGTAPAALAQLFPVQVRSTGMSLAYNIAAIFFAGFTPALMAWATTLNKFAPSFYLAVIGVAGLTGLALMKKLQYKY
ncbi:MFS transporter [Lonepinella sp. BR2271]|uniref:MFS transporter n=1 Tax=Lonepinella sp. BR2271 TaxID=3434550 RepID=UPI003F6E1816